MGPVLGARFVDNLLKLHFSVEQTKEGYFIMTEFEITISDLDKEEIKWFNSRLNTKSYGHFTYKLLGKRRKEDPSFTIYTESTGFSIWIKDENKIPYEAIAKALKKAFPNSECSGIVRESKSFDVSENCRMKYYYDVPLVVSD